MISVMKLLILKKVEADVSYANGVDYPPRVVDVFLVTSIPDYDIKRESV